MLRKLHSLSGLLAAVVLTVMALSGAVLSVQPALEYARAASVASPLDAATLVGRIQARYPNLNKVVRKPSGEIVAHYASAGGSSAMRIDPETGAGVQPDRPSAAMRWITNLHRNLLLGDTGRVMTAVAAGLMMLLGASGAGMLARRMGGWRHLFGRIRGDGLQRVHNEIARAAFLALMLSAITGLVMSMTSFGWLPERGMAELPYPDAASASAPVPVAQSAALRSIDVNDLRELTLPSSNIPGDVYAVTTADGTGYIDPASGTWLAWQNNGAWQRVQQTVYRLHTGEGLWWLALALGLGSAAVPVLVFSGIALWARRCRATPGAARGASPNEADTIILVGSETNATWAFAAALHQALTRARFRVDMSPMNDLRSTYRRAERLIVLTSTYGDGDAPASATRFLPALAHLNVDREPALQFAVLGFGDRQFPQFCGFARTVQGALLEKGLRPLLECETVDRQSESTFRQWTERLGTALGVTLDVEFHPSLPRTTMFEVVERKDYGSESDRKVCVLRLAPKRRSHSLWHKAFGSSMPSFEPGDLLGVVPPGHTVPRFYSLASASRDGFLEICVRRHPHGACSTYLSNLEPGETVAAFIRANERFKPAAGAAPLILIGAGTGIGPFVGFIRQNGARRPMYVYFGARRSGRSFLYDEELQHLSATHRLTTLTTALSSAKERTYVQERLLADSATLRALVTKGAMVMVCGGRDMAKGVASAWERILEGSGLTVGEMKLRGSYVEDVY